MGAMDITEADITSPITINLIITDPIIMGMITSRIITGIIITVTDGGNIIEDIEDRRPRLKAGDVPNC